MKDDYSGCNNQVEAPGQFLNGDFEKIVTLFIKMT